MEIIIITVTFERSDSAFSLYFSVAYNTCAWALLLCSFFCFYFCLYSWFSSYCRCWCWWCCCSWCRCFINGILSNAQVDCRNDIMNQMKNNNIAYLKMTRANVNDEGPSPCNIRFNRIHFIITIIIEISSYCLNLRCFPLKPLDKNQHHHHLQFQWIRDEKISCKLAAMVKTHTHIRLHTCIHIHLLDVVCLSLHHTTVHTINGMAKHTRS